MDQMDLKYLQYALAVARCGSVTRAAQELYLAQPNLSRAIGEFEQSLGFPLFIRTRQGMQPTPQGKRFLTEAEKLLENLFDVARECRQSEVRSIHFACVPSSLFVNSILEAGRRAAGLTVQCEEYYSCVELFERVGKGKSQAAFLTFGVEMREELLDYFARRGLNYRSLAQTPAYGVVHHSSGMYHPESDPPSICYNEARLLLSVTYFEPIGIRFSMKRSMLPASKGICHGVGRAGNLDMLETMEDLVMISCHVHSKVIARNELAVVPLHPERMAYEYGYVTKAEAPLGDVIQGFLTSVEKEIQRELCRS